MCDRLSAARDMRGRSTVTALILVAGIMLLSAAPPVDAARVVRAQELGSRWPLSVTDGEIDCVPGQQVGSVRVDAAVFRTKGKTYALNGAARQRGYLPIEPIWKQDAAVPQLRVNLGPLIDMALKECR